jgi:hypothetical protein
VTVTAFGPASPVTATLPNVWTVLAANALPGGAAQATAPAATAIAIRPVRTRMPSPPFRSPGAP